MFILPDKGLSLLFWRSSDYSPTTVNKDNKVYTLTPPRITILSYLKVVEGFKCPDDHRGYTVWGFQGLPREQVLGDGSDKAPMKTKKSRHVTFPWSKAWGWVSLATAWWSGFMTCVQKLWHSDTWRDVIGRNWPQVLTGAVFHCWIYVQFRDYAFCTPCYSIKMSIGALGTRKL